MINLKWIWLMRSHHCCCLIRFFGFNHLQSNEYTLTTTKQINNRRGRRRKQQEKKKLRIWKVNTLKIATNHIRENKHIKINTSRWHNGWNKTKKLLFWVITLGRFNSVIFINEWKRRKQRNKKSEKKKKLTNTYS